MAGECEDGLATPMRKRRRWSWRTRLRVTLVVMLLLGVAGWRFGWPPRSWETSVYPLEEIDWREAVRLEPDCISPNHVSGARHVYLAEGSLNDSGLPVFDLREGSWHEPDVIPLRSQILPTLILPDLAGRRFQAGVFWVDMPDAHSTGPVECLDPAAAYAVLVTCDETRRWEEAAQLTVDLNRNRDLTDDPVMQLSDAWSQEHNNPRVEFGWTVRVFEEVELLRTRPSPKGGQRDTAIVRALPVFTPAYFENGKVLDWLDLAFYPTTFRRGRLPDDFNAREVLVSPSRTLFGCFDGSSSAIFPLDGPWKMRHHGTQWSYERGTFWSCELDAAGTRMRDGPYRGPIGQLEIETAGGVPLRISNCWLWRRGNPSRQVFSEGWAPVPRFPDFTFPMSEHPLPVGDYGIDRMVLRSDDGGTITIRADNTLARPSQAAFSILDGKTTRWRLPAQVQSEVIASINERTGPYHVTQVWSSEEEPPDEADAEWTGPTPGGELNLDLRMTVTDAESGNRFAITVPRARGAPPRVVIRNEDGKVVHEGTMEYG